MIIKIKTQDTGWVLFDEAKNVKYDTMAATSDHRALQDWFEGEAHFIGVDEEKFGNGESESCVVEFIRNDVEYAVFFNTLAYLCNDSGRTVDKIIPSWQ